MLLHTHHRAWNETQNTLARRIHGPLNVGVADTFWTGFSDFAEPEVCIRFSSETWLELQQTPSLLPSSVL